jgi:hypothetical protein
MSSQCEAFIQAVLRQSWRAAFLNLNGLNMFEMLRALAALDPGDLDDLWNQHAGNGGDVNMPRIEYAFTVVLNRRLHLGLPMTAPGDLLSTGQLGDAQNFLAESAPYLSFGRDLTGREPAAHPEAAVLADPDFVAAAARINVEVSAIMAVTAVEAGRGFEDGRPIIRYELHRFHHFTRGLYDQTHPHLSQRTRAAGERFHNRGQPNEWSLMRGAMILRGPGRARRVENAWESASWGRFQVMGEHFRMGGWTDIDTFVQDMFDSEGQHLRAGVGYIIANNLAGALRSHDWAAFALGYNGPGFRENQYDLNLQAQYAAIRATRIRQGLRP